MCCDGPEYEHLDDNEIVSIVSKSGDDDKQHDEGKDISKKIPKSSISHSDAMSKIDDMLEWYRCVPDAALTKGSNLELHEIAAQKRDSITHK